MMVAYGFGPEKLKKEGPKIVSKKTGANTKMVEMENIFFYVWNEKAC